VLTYQGVMAVQKELERMDARLDELKGTMAFQKAKNEDRTRDSIQGPCLEVSALKRASLDLSRALAKLRQGK